jgi:hypothetical protein
MCPSIPKIRRNVTPIGHPGRVYTASLLKGCKNKQNVKHGCKNHLVSWWKRVHNSRQELFCVLLQVRMTTKITLCTLAIMGDTLVNIMKAFLVVSSKKKPLTNAGLWIRG